MNKEHRISKEGGASRHILTRAFGAPSFDIPCSIFDIRYSFFPFLLHSLKKYSAGKWQDFTT
jgi:hypothetical protein